MDSLETAVALPSTEEEFSTLFESLGLLHAISRAHERKEIHSIYTRTFIRVCDLVIASVCIPFAELVKAYYNNYSKKKYDEPGTLTQKRFGKHGVIIDVEKLASTHLSKTPLDIHLGKPGAEKGTGQNMDDFMREEGYFLRKTSIDELLQFHNIFRGEMSVAGPRPLWMNSVLTHPLEEKRYMSRLDNGVDAQTPGLIDIPTLYKIRDGLDESKPEDMNKIIELEKESHGYWKKHPIMYYFKCIVLALPIVLNGKNR